MNTLKFAPVDVKLVRRTDGSMLFTNAMDLPEGGVETMPDCLAHWARHRPDTLFLSALEGDDRPAITYAQAWSKVVDLSARLLTLPVSTQNPLMIVANNGLGHALAMLAATRVGIPVAIVSPAYCNAAAAPWTKFARLVDLVGPGAILADDIVGMGPICAAIGHPDLPLWPVRNLSLLHMRQPAPPADVALASAAVNADTVAKLLFTSGSTGSPKAVINTQGMMVSNMKGLNLVWPFLRATPPVLVDWLPWNHTFGGNCCFNLALYFGGTLHIDDGKPLPSLIGRTVQALRHHKPTVYFNVPGGYEALLPFLESEPELARHFFTDLDFLFNAAAPLPAAVKTRLQELAVKVTGTQPVIAGGWGSTETAPFSTVLYFDTKHATNLGVPLPGTTIKLSPSGGRTELRVRGPNVMPGYWHQDDATAAVFDDEGYYCIGDAGRFADPEHPGEGILFDGRLAENFKLSSGTWVNVGALRLAVIAAMRPLISDVVVAGEGRDEIGLLLFTNEAACRALVGDDQCEPLKPRDLFKHPRLTNEITAMLDAYNKTQMGRSTRAGCWVILAEPPNALDDEITEKGYINQRAVLRRRDAIVSAMYSAADMFWQA